MASRVFIKFKNRMKSIREVIDTICVCALVFKYQHDVEARIELDKNGVLINVSQCCLCDVKSLTTSDGLQGSFYRVKSTRLHFNEDEVCVVMKYDVNFSIFNSEVLAKQLISLTYQEVSCKVFTYARELILCFFNHGSKKRLT